MIRPPATNRPGRGRLCVAAALVTAGVGLAACTGSGSEPPGDPSTTGPTPTLPVTACLDQAVFELVVEELSPEEFLDRVHEDDVEAAQAIFYPDDHPQAGEYVPLPEWGPEQQRAWSVFITARRQMDDLLPILYERLVEQLTPEEFFSRLNEAEADAARNLVYPEDHPQAGEFVTDRWVGLSWEQYLLTRSAGPGCPW